MSFFWHSLLSFGLHNIISTIDGGEPKQDCNNKRCYSNTFIPLGTQVTHSRHGTIPAGGDGSVTAMRPVDVHLEGQGPEVGTL